MQKQSHWVALQDILKEEATHDQIVVFYFFTTQLLKFPFVGMYTI